MAFSPDSISKQHVLDAVMKIEQKQLTLHPSTRYDVVINGKPYPPKEVMRFAHYEMNGEMLWNQSGGEPTNRYLEKMGFEIVNKGEGPEEEPNYWLFQANPNVYDLKTALREDLLDHWTVTAHKEQIKIGDKVIIWQSGKEAGCFALAEVTHEPYVAKNMRDEHLWQRDEKVPLQAAIKITHNLVEKPLFREITSTIPALNGLKAGNRGTNFASTREEYETLKELAEKSDEAQYWIYAPGQNADRWDEFYEKGILAIGWDYTGDLTKYQSREEITIKLQSLPGSKGSRMNDAAACDDFAHIMQVGDIIFAKAGTNEFLGYGIVTSGYFFDLDREDYQHCRKVDWKIRGSWPSDRQLAQKALTNITHDLDRIGKLRGLFKKLTIEENQMTQGPKNIILYGPPGTGKTYSSISRSVELATGTTPSNHKIAKAEFDRLRAEGQIAFVTFHQNYAYEDFMIGIRPDATADQHLRFASVPGIFYQLSKRAQSNYLSAIAGNDTRRPFDEVFADFVEPLADDGKEIEVKMASGSHSFWITDLNEYNLSFRKQTGDTQHTLSLNTLHEIYEGTRIAPGGLRSYYNPLVELLQTKGKRTGSKTNLLNYVLVIDEINRANISRVFGELITLLEDDKRLGAENELRINLANGDEFAVPPNLFLLGTMNTADKSIALVDIALRRRFTFEGKYPEYGNLSSPTADLLRKLNAAIFKEKGSADYLIGHAYFMKGDDIVDVLRTKVIPLLMEYFSGKIERVQDVFATTGWAVQYDLETYSWRITEP